MVGGKACPHSEETRACNKHLCPVACTMHAWRPWSPCTKSCGRGTQRRSRTLVAPRHGGLACAHSAETRTCNTVACPVDCVAEVFGAKPCQATSAWKFAVPSVQGMTFEHDKHSTAMDKWCAHSCNTATPFCPEDRCSCTATPRPWSACTRTDFGISRSAEGLPGVGDSDRQLSMRRGVLARSR